MNFETNEPRQKELEIAALRMAASQAAKTGDLPEAIRLLERAISIEHASAPGSLSPPVAVGLRIDLRLPLLREGRVDDVLLHLNKARGLAAGVRDFMLLAEVDSYLAHALWLKGDHTGSIAAARRALNEIPPNAARDRAIGCRTVTLFRLGKIFHSIGQYEQAGKCFTRCIDELHKDSHRLRHEIRGDPLAIACSWLVWSYGEIGDFRTAIMHGNRALRRSRQLQDDYSTAFALLALGTVLLGRGEARKAIGSLRRGLEVCPDDGSHILIPRLYASIGACYARLGSPDEGIRLVERAIASLELTSERAAVEGPQPRGPSGWLNRVADTYTLAGRFAEAENVAQNALRVATERRERGYEAWSLKSLGDAARGRTGSPGGSAPTYYRRAARLARELGMRPLSAHCEAGVASDEIARGEPGGIVRMSAARNVYISMGMHAYAERCRLAMGGHEAPRLS